MKLFKPHKLEEAKKEFECLKKLSKCDFVINVHDIYLWEEQKKMKTQNIIWLKLDLAEKSLQDDIDWRIKEKRPYTYVEIVRMLFDILSAILYLIDVGILNRGI